VSERTRTRAREEKRATGAASWPSLARARAPE